MPVVRSEESKAEYGFDIVDPRQQKYKPTVLPEPESKPKAAGNATGTAIHLEEDLSTDHNWREKLQNEDEGDYTRLRLMEDEESEEVHMRTKYLFDEDKAMTPLSQMQATKELLTEGQRIAYVGLCALVARGMIREMGRGWVMTKRDKLRGKGSDEPEVVESGRLWMLKIMAKLYQHMDLSPDGKYLHLCVRVFADSSSEQRMIDSLAEHGVTPEDLAPSLMTTHTIANPEYDEAEARRQEDMQQDSLENVIETENKTGQSISGDRALDAKAIEARFEKAAPNEGDIPKADLAQPSPSYQESDNDEADIADLVGTVTLEDTGSGTATPKPERTSAEVARQHPPVVSAEEQKAENPLALGRALPGVSTTLSKTDKNVTLDIRWTVVSGTVAGRPYSC